MMALREQITEARREAYREAKSLMPWVWSRGAYIATVDANGNQCEPSPGADATAWDGRMGSINAFIERVTREHPIVDRVIIEGGYDGGETIADKMGSCYEPWIASWTVEAWRRKR